MSVLVPAKDEPEWMQILRADIQASGSISATAARVGIARSSLSAIVNMTASSPYATGKASTAKVQERVMNTIGLVACPFLSEYHGSEHRITGLQCREYAYRENPPTSAPREMQHWRACQGCEKRVKQAAPPKLAPIKAAAQDRSEPVQQAGVIDKVTLPLPEVGGPQVEVMQ